MRDKLFFAVSVFGFLFFFSSALVSRHSDLVAPLVDSPAKTIGSDFNGDGISDIIMGADLNDDQANDAGAVYLLYGSGGLSSSYALNGAGVNVTIIGKAATNYLGENANSAGDINSDGFFDVVMGAFGNDDAATDAGAIYILYGHPSLAADYRLNGGGVDATLLGKALLDRLGGRDGTSGAGDVNGDGFDDLIVGAWLNDDGPGANNAGAAYILYGGGTAFSGTINIAATADTDVTILGKATNDGLGDFVSSAGDVNADGFDDVIVGAYGNEDVAAGSGASYVLFGGTSLSATINIAGAGADVSLLGGSATSRFGRAISGLGDVNGDGFADFGIGAFLDDNVGGTDAGASYIIYGRRFGSATTISMATVGPNVTIVGDTGIDDRLGRSIASAGDVNDDGFHDIITGADDTGTVNTSGSSHIYYGGASLASQIPMGNSDVTVTGKSAGDAMGIRTTGLGDVNNDGFPDVAMTALYNDDGGGADAGTVYVILGSDSLAASITAGNSNVTILGKAASDRFGIGLGGGQGHAGP